MWYEIRIENIERYLEEPVSDFLIRIGSSGTYSEKDVVVGYIHEKCFRKDIPEKVKAFLKRLSEDFPSLKPKISVKKIEQKDWEEKWKRFYKPIKVTEDLTIIPAWEKINKKGCIIRIDPGPAFGTGQHPTTRLCLRAIKEVPKKDDWNMIDIGTGTGILAIYGAMIGAKEVLAIDIDPIAIEWAKHNARINSVSEKIRFSDEPLENVSGSFYIAVSNIDLDEIKRIFPHIFRISERWIILSGILKEEERLFRSFLEEYRFSEKKISCEEDWICFVLKK